MLKEEGQNEKGEASLNLRLRGKKNDLNIN